jgi:hypothetical protein
MLMTSEAGLDSLDKDHPGIKKSILEIEAKVLPACAHCGSDDTASVGIGIVGRSMRIAGATTKYHLIAGGPKPGAFFCNSCREYFNAVPGTG